MSVLIDTSVLVEGYVAPETLVSTSPKTASLLEDVQAFHDASLRGEYHETFDVNWKNCMDSSP